MAVKEHHQFSPPENPGARIWRYMDLTKFLSLLDKRSLYFCRLDLLSNLDPFEGHHTNLFRTFISQVEQELPNLPEEVGPKEQILGGLVEAIDALKYATNYHRTITYVNSWHLKEIESAAMWKLYLSNNEGIAIQSTYSRLVKSLDTYKDFDILIGKIKYMDYEKGLIPFHDFFSPFIFKRKSFEYEEELRALIWTAQDGKNDPQNPTNNKFKDVEGIYVPVDVNMLIENVYVAPSAPKWVLELIKSVSRKYDISKDIVIQSDLSRQPLY